MGTSPSSFFSRDGKVSNDTDVKFVDSRNRYRHKSAAQKSQSKASPGRYFSTSPDPSARGDKKSQPKDIPPPAETLLSLSPKQRSLAYSKSPAPSFVKRGEGKDPWKTDYSPSAIRSTRTSPYSYKMTSENVLAYPSPNQLRSTPLSYTNDYGKTTPVLHIDQDPGIESLTDQRSLPIGERMRSGFYSSVPSPDWKPLSRESDFGGSCTSIRSVDPWGQPPNWDDRKRESTGYYCDDDHFNMGKARDSSYF